MTAPNTVLTGTGLINDAVFTYDRRLSAVRRYVEANLSLYVSAEIAAETLGLTRNYFSTFFRRTTGVTFGRWVTSLRVERARRLIETTNKPILKIGFAVGFRDNRTFQRAFKRFTGLTPSQYGSSVRRAWPQAASNA